MVIYPDYCIDGIIGIYIVKSALIYYVKRKKKADRNGYAPGFLDRLIGLYHKALMDASRHFAGASILLCP